MLACKHENPELRAGVARAFDYFIHLGLGILKRRFLLRRRENFGLVKIDPVRRGGTVAA